MVSREKKNLPDIRDLRASLKTGALSSRYQSTSQFNNNMVVMSTMC